MHSARWLLEAAHADFRPHKALVITAVFLATLPNLGPKVVQTFWLQVPVHKHLRYCPTSPKIIEGGNCQGYSVSLNTTLVYVIVARASVMCPLAISLAFCLKSSILMSYTMWHHTNW